MQPPSVVSPRALFEQNLGEIERIVAWISRRACLTGDDAEEFRSWVNIRLMEDDFRIVRRHAGRSSLKTYLSTVILNLVRDYRIKRWGRWRPSAAAERLGVTAVQLETLVSRDGFSLSDATEMLQRHHGVRMSAVEIATLAEQLPWHTRLVVESGEGVEQAPARERSDEGLREAEGKATLAKVRVALKACLAELDVEERLILRMHYESGLTIAAVASSLGIEQRRLYTRRDALLRRLRTGLEQRGVDPGCLFDALAASDDDGELDFQDSGPSNQQGPKGKSEE